jgi:hypothetical protein
LEAAKTSALKDAVYRPDAVKMVDTARHVEKEEAASDLVAVNKLYTADKMEEVDAAATTETEKILDDRIAEASQENLAAVPSELASGGVMGLGLAKPARVLGAEPAVGSLQALPGTIPVGKEDAMPIVTPGVSPSGMGAGQAYPGQSQSLIPLCYNCCQRGHYASKCFQSQKPRVSNRKPSSINSQNQVPLQ